MSRIEERWAHLVLSVMLRPMLLAAWSPVHRPVSFALLIGVVSLSGVAPALAQGNEMGQGEANITARADVRMSVESGPATSGDKLSLIGGVIGSRLAAIRTCYNEVTQSRPTVTGEMRLAVTLSPGGGSFNVTRDTLEDRPLTRCTMRELRRADLASLRPPGTAYIALNFTNSAAAGVHETRARRAEEDAAPVHRNAEGRLESTGRTEGGEVRFRVLGSPRSSEAQVQAVQAAVRAMIPSLLDCRRKAARRTSPNGDITMRLSIRPNGRAQARTIRNGVEDPRGQRCVERAMRRARFGREGRGQAEVTVTFADRAPVAAAPE